MRLKHIITTFAVIALTAANCMADEISPMLTARRRPSLTEQKQPVVTEPSTCLDNSEMNLVIPEETAPVFKPYQLSKGEVLFSYTKDGLMLLILLLILTEAEVTFQVQEV
ncbi:MAG: hypothetical protein ACLSA2_05075 [Candidatus Gastranaerophilaceae bacterium]